MVVVLSVCSADIHYEVDESGLTRSIQPKVLKSFSLIRQDHIAWDRIEWYASEYDRTRSWRAYPYLLIKGKEKSF